jgi:acetylglutamate kinase
LKHHKSVSTINVIKIGGNVIDNPEKLLGFLKKFSELKGPKVLVHGGGKIATKIAQDLGIESKLVDGRRITDAPMRDVVTMVYGGLVNKQIVARLQSLDCNAIGLTGADGRAILAHKRPVKEIDYGFVGDIEKVNTEFIFALLTQGITPVFAPLTFDAAGDMLNTNADTQASEIAKALIEKYEVNLIYCFEKKGVLLDADDDSTRIPELKPDTYQQYKNEGVIYAGMIPKLDNAFAAVTAGVKRVIICEADDIKEAIKNQAGTVISI